MGFGDKEMSLMRCYRVLRVPLDLGESICHCLADKKGAVFCRCSLINNLSQTSPGPSRWYYNPPPLIIQDTEGQPLKWAQSKEGDPDCSTENKEAGSQGDVCSAADQVPRESMVLVVFLLGGCYYASPDRL